MKLIYRILLFIFCITIIPTAPLSPAYSTELNHDLNHDLILDFTQLPTETISDAQPTTTNEEFETLEKNYVQLEFPNDSPTDFSITKTIERFFKSIQNNYYSLLNWSTQTRNGELKIENYNRKLKFGRWINDPNDDSCLNTRALVLVRDSIQNVIFKKTNHCSVESGSWNDPYTGKNFSSSTDIQIDHVVPLKNAYLSGAYRWNFKTRCLYANYLGAKFHLLSVNSSENMRKGDRAPDRYMPPNTEFSCTYLKDWLSIKFLWGLKMTTAEAAAISKLVKTNACDLIELQINDHEIQTQADFFKSKIDLCEKLDVANKEEVF